MKIYRYDAQKNQYEDVEVVKLQSSKYKYLVVELLLSSDFNQTVDISASSLISKNKEIKNVITCFNQRIELTENQPKSVFFGFDLINVPFGQAKSVLNLGEKSVGIIIDVDDTPIFFNGTDDPSSLSRLKFLNSNICNNKELLDGFKGITANKNVISILGKDVVFGSNGLVENVYSYFDESNTLCNEPQKILFFDKSTLDFAGQDIEFFGLKINPHERYAYITAKGRSPKLSCDINAKLWYDGGINYKIVLTAQSDVVISNFGLNMHFAACKYRLNNFSGSFSDMFYQQNIQYPCYFLGDVNCGSKIGFNLDEKSWNNFGKGNISLDDDALGVNLKTQTGVLIIPKGNSLEFKFDLMLTPIKPIDIKKQFDINVFNKGISSKTYGQNYALITKLPIENFIYPYKEQLKSAVFAAHKEDIGVIMPFKINHIDPDNIDYRLFAALNVKNYDNYNLEILNYLINVICIDGVLLDSSSVSRESAERCAKLLQKHNKDGLIELLNDYGGNPIDKMTALMDLTPFVSRLVIKNAVYRDPEYVLCELSGILCGALSETCDKGVNPIMALLYGMKLRLGASFKGNDMMANCILKLFEDLNLKNGRMRGYWDAANPMSADNPNIYITTYISGDNMLAAIFNYSQKDTVFNLGINPKKQFTSVDKKIETPLISGLQKQNKINLNKPLKLKAKKGIIITITK